MPHRLLHDHGSTEDSSRASLLPKVSINPGSDPREGPAAQPAEHLGPYELLVELASGGMATVYLARAHDNRQGSALVAIKRPHRHLATDKVFLSMLVDEARLASAIDHPNVAKVRELRFEGAIPFIVMDYIEGASLAELRRELTAIARTVDVRIAVRIVLDALAGLQAAHDLVDESGKPLHIIHRDVSPHNVIVGCNGRSYITDFGIAQAEHRIQTTRTHEVKGKLAYLAPERVDKRRICTVQSDVFSMGVVLWECFAGRRLFNGEEAVDILSDLIGAPIPRLRQLGARIPEALDDVIARALSRDLDVRHPTARSLAEAIQQALGPANVGQESDVARLMEAVFGAAMARRHEQIQASMGERSADFGELLRGSGLDPRPLDGTREPLAGDLAVPAPTARYAVGAALPKRPWVNRRRAFRWAVAAGSLTFGIILGVIVTLAMSSRWKAALPSARSSQGHTVTAPAAPTATTYEGTLSAPPDRFGAAVKITSDAGSARDSTGPRENRPVGVVRDGFTKLR